MAASNDNPKPAHGRSSRLSFLLIVLMLCISILVLVVLEIQLRWRKSKNVPVAFVTRCYPTAEIAYLLVDDRASVERIMACLPGIADLPDCQYPFHMGGETTLELWYPGDLKTQTVYFDTSMRKAETYFDGGAKLVHIEGNISTVIDELRPDFEIAGPDFPADVFELRGRDLLVARLSRFTIALMLVAGGARAFLRRRGEWAERGGSQHSTNHE